MIDNARAAAEEARTRAYAPYSGFLVGAALTCASGVVISGCNVENISLGLTICAERTCVVKAVAQGEQSFRHLTIIADSDEPIVPCGGCRQVLAEFAPNLPITTWTLSGTKQDFSLTELLPVPKQGILQVPRGT
jgi:cytidine deaminase